MRTCQCVAAVSFTALLLSGCVGPHYAPTPPDARTLQLHEPQERLVKGGRVIFPKGFYNPVAAAYGGVLYQPEGFVYVPAAEQLFRAGVLIPGRGASDARQGLWELDDIFGSDSLSGKIVVLRFEPPLVFESLPDRE